MEKVGKTDRNDGEHVTKYAVSDTEPLSEGYVASDSPIDAADSHTKYVVSDSSVLEDVETHTKYAVATELSSGPPSGPAALERRRHMDLAIEEVLSTVTAAIQRVLPEVSPDARARLVASLVGKYGDRLLHNHLAVIRHLSVDESEPK